MAPTKPETTEEFLERIRALRKANPIPPEELAAFEARGRELSKELCSNLNEVAESNDNDLDRRIAELVARDKANPRPPEEVAALKAAADAMVGSLCRNLDRNVELDNRRPEPKTRIDQAREFATEAHKGQKRKGTNIDYIVHPLAVSKILQEAGCEEDVVAAALLHDCEEDCEHISLEDIAKKFGYRVAGIVEGCSEPDKSLSWTGRKEHTIEYMKTAPIEVKLVVCADKLHNVSTMLDDYRKVGESLWSRFNEGPDKQRWYYSSIVESLGANGFNAHPLHQALADKVEKLFVRRLENLIVDRAVKQMQQMKDGGLLSGEDSGLLNTWDEICAQVQDGYSMFWDAYELTFNQVLHGEVASLAEPDRLLLCHFLGTDSNNEIVEYLNSELVSRAEDCENPRVRRYINSRYEADYPYDDDNY